ncbi:MAG: hypothetical protein ACRELV_08905 [Longimicrobiales bacterium]
MVGSGMMPIAGRRDPTEAERAIRASLAGAILGILLALLGRSYPEK